MALTINDFGEAVTYGELEFKRKCVEEFRDTLVQVGIASLAAASVAFMVAPRNGNIVSIGATLHGALTVGTPTLAFATDMATPLTFANIAGATALPLTFSGSGAGSVFTSTLATPFAITQGRAIRVTNTVNSQATASTATVYVVIRSTEILLG